jgi:nucleoside-diphosphate-sugar epimerase
LTDYLPSYVTIWPDLPNHRIERDHSIQQGNPMHTILGAGGSIGKELVGELLRGGKKVRLVGRNPRDGEGTETVAADLSSLEQTVGAVSGSEIAYLLVGLKYDLKVWRTLWPRIMKNTIEACKRTHARLIFFDNVYMYGLVRGAMTEETPFNPCSRKGEVRAEIATLLLNEIKGGNLTALIARSADFYGPGAKTGVPNVLVLNRFAAGTRAMWLANDSTKHSITFTPDAAKSLALLAGSDKAWNQTWHVPTAPDPPTGKEFIRVAAREFGVAPKYRVFSKPMVRVAGLFDATVRELYEMLYQNEYDYLFHSTKIEKAFNFAPTSYAEGIRIACAALAEQRGVSARH